MAGGAAGEKEADFSCQGFAKDIQEMGNRVRELGNRLRETGNGIRETGNGIRETGNRREMGKFADSPRII
jgi:hypothetical protein